MGRAYSVSFTAASVAAVQDLFNLLAPASAGIRLLAASLGQDSSTASAELRIAIKRVTGSPTTGSGGASATPAPRDPGDAASGVTARVNDTTRLTGGTSTTLFIDTFNVLNGWQYTPIPEARPVAAPSTRLMIGLETAPGAALTLSGTATYEELG